MPASTRSENKNILIKWCVLLGDILLYALIVAFVATYLQAYTPQSVWRHIPIAVTLGGVMLVLFSLLFPSLVHRRRIDLGEIVRRNVLVAFFSQLSFALLWHMITILSGNETIYSIIVSIILFISLVIKRLYEITMLGYLRKNGRNTRHVILVGNDPAILNIYNEIMTDPTTGYHVLGYYGNDEIADAPSALEHLGSQDELIRLITHCPQSVPSADDMFCSLPHADDKDILLLMQYCDRKIVRFYYLPRMLPNIHLLLKPEMIGNNIVYTSHHEPLSHWGNRVAKRFFDVFFSVLVLISLLPLLPIIWCIIKVQSPGPLFFRQQRTGMNGQDFTCYKFRSMHVNDAADTKQATKDDPRKFAFGNFMRRMNIDELPQFFCVLRGDMSIVGPRPHMKLHTQQYSALISKYMVRHFAKPGITGWAQVSGYRGETEELWQMEGRVKRDIWYIEHWSFWLDIRICFLTFASLFTKDENAY